MHQHPKTHALVCMVAGGEEKKFNMCILQLHEVQTPLAEPMQQLQSVSHALIMCHTYTIHMWLNEPHI